MEKFEFVENLISEMTIEEKIAEMKKFLWVVTTLAEVAAESDVESESEATQAA